MTKAKGPASDVLIGEFATGVNATAKGMINGATIDSDGAHESNVLVGVAS